MEKKSGKGELYTVIDVGSNTVKYSSYRVKWGKKGFSQKKCGGRSETVRLIHYIKDGILSEEGLSNLCAVLRTFKESALQDEVPEEHLFCFATAGFRRLASPETVIAEVYRRTGVTIRLLTGQEEAAMSFRGMLLTTSPRTNEGLMLDMGGGSTEILGFRNDEAFSAISHPFGALSLYEDFVKGEFPTAEEAEQIRRFVRETVQGSCEFQERIVASDGSVHGYIVGGTAKAIGAMNVARNADKSINAENPETPPEQKKKSRPILSFAAFKDQLNAYLTGEEGERERIREAYPDRYRVITPGMLAYVEIFTLAGVETVHIADGGLRDGYLYEYLKEQCK